MDISGFSSFEGLTDIGLRGGVDMRPTLLRVLTDLYVQKLTHTPEEERHYTELALRLLDSVDMPTRAATASRLAHYLVPPARVIERLLGDLPEVAAPLRSRSAPLAAAAHPAAPNSPLPSHLDTERTAFAAEPDTIGADIAAELNELFFTAGADERRLILLNIDIVVARRPHRTSVSRDPSIGRRLEAAALARKRQEFTLQLARSLSISREQAQRVAADKLGEPIVVAAKVLSIPRDLLYRILLFVNTSVGHSVERVHALADIFDRISVQAAQDLVAVWQALASGIGQSTAPSRLLPPRSLPPSDERDPQPAAATRRMTALPPNSERRRAS